MRIKTITKMFSAVLSAAMLVTSVPSALLAEPAAPAETDQTVTEGNPLRLWYNTAATDWQQHTLPIGNGDIGANIYGGIASEHLTFNEKTLWTGGPSDSRPNYIGGNLESKGNNGEAVKEIQQLFADGNSTQASSKCDQNLVGGQEGYGAYQAWGDIYFDYQDVTDNAAQEYVRDLDLETALSTVSFQENDTLYTREFFVSNPDNVMAAKLAAEGSRKLNLNVRFTSKQGATAVASGDTLVVAGSVSDNQLKYDSVLRVVNNGGTVTASGAQLQVRDAESITVYVSAATDYKNDYPVYRTGETAEALHTRVAEDVDAAVQKGYDAIKEDHIADYRALFTRMSLDLGAAVSAKPTNELLAAYNNKTASEVERRQLETMLFQYGRYLTISSSRENSQLPSNLQGVWNNVNNPQWASDYHMNVNLQMNYWPTYVTNLAECAKPLISYVDSLREPGRVTAEIYAGIKSEEGEENGFMAHTQNTPFGWTCPGWAFSWGWSPAAVPWILQNCWEYYDFTRDAEYLADNIYPMMKEEAVLYDKMLIDDGEGKLVSSPSYSPEHGPYTSGNTYEQSLIWQLYEDVIEAAEIVGEEDTEKVNKWKSNQKNLKGPIEIGSDGQVKEWYTETTLGSVGGEGYGHRHLSHMLGLFPGDLISVETPEWLEAANVSMNNRTDESTGWGMGQRINTWARLGNGNKAYKLITDLFKGGIYANLWDTHPPFQIDGNFGYTAGVAEMLIQSNVGYINLLPALPDVWPEGEANGLMARGNFEIDMKWSKGQVDTVTLTSNKGNEAVIQYNNVIMAEVTDEDGNPVEFKKLKNNKISFDTETGKTYTISGLPEKEEAPSNLRILNKAKDTVTLAWDAAASEGMTYNVYRKTDSGVITQIASGITDTSYTDAEAYDILGIITYQVTAGSGMTESVMSDSVRRFIGTEVLDDQDTDIQYTGAWENWNREGENNYNDTIKFLQSPNGGETASLTFEGTGIEVIVCKNSDRGKLEITIDGVSCGEVDTYASPTERQSVAFSKKDLAQGEHTIVIKATNTKNASSSGTKIEMDAIRVIHSEEEITPPSLPSDSRHKVLAVEDGRVMAQWEETQDADSYNIYVNGELAGTADKPYAWIEAEAGEELQIVIKAVKDTVESETSISFSTTMPSEPETPEAVTGLTAVRDASDPTVAQVTWEPSDGADRYLVYLNNKQAASVTEPGVSISGLDTSKEYKILVYAVAGQNNMSEFAEVKVEAMSAIPVAAISVAEKNKNLNVGETYSIKASITPAMAEVTYRSSNDKVAKVDANGKVTAVAEGEADITIAGKVNPGVTASVHIKVTKAGKAVPVPALNTLIEGADLQYTVTKSDAVNGTVTVSAVTAAGKNKGTITIPATVEKDGYSFKVTAINKNVFKDCKKKLKSVVIGANVTEIGANSFNKCSKIKNIRFMGTTAPKKAGKNAFKGIKSTCKIFYPKSMSKSELKKLKKIMKSAGKKVKYKKK